MNATNITPNAANDATSTVGASTSTAATTAATKLHDSCNYNHNNQWYVAIPDVQNEDAKLVQPVLLSSKPDLQAFCTQLCPCVGYQAFDSLAAALAFLMHQQQTALRNIALTQEQRVTTTTTTTTTTHVVTKTAKNSQQTVATMSNQKRKTLPTQRDCNDSTASSKENPKKRQRNGVALPTTNKYNHGNATTTRNYQENSKPPSTNNGNFPTAREKFLNCFGKYMPQLRQWQQQHGTTDVPYPVKIHGDIIVLNNGKEVAASSIPVNLGSFVTKLRNQYRMYRVSKPTSWLNATQAAQVRALGDFDVEPKPQVWNVTRYDQLKEFYQQHGHAHVPTVSPSKSDPNYKWRPLRLWINELLKAHYEKQHGRHCTLTESHLELLRREVGFKFDDYRTPHRTFDEKAMEWLAYKAAHSQDCPPDRRHPVRKWINYIRKQYNQKQAGKHTCVTTAQWKQLKEWDFPFDSGFAKPIAPPAKAKTFKERLEELAAYKRQYGDLLVPQKYPSLGGWVSCMRAQYEKRCKGQPAGRLTDERLAQLQEIGFVFTPQPNGPRFLKAAGKEKELQTRQLQQEWNEYRCQRALEYGNGG